MKGILFKDFLIPAVKSGAKTQTRRAIKDIAPGSELLPYTMLGWTFLDSKEVGNSDRMKMASVVQPKYKESEVVYVKEAHCYVMKEHAHDLLEGWKDSNQYVLKSMVNADWMQYAKEQYGYAWKSPMFMPKAAARTFIRIKSVRPEKLGDISERDCIAEGIERVDVAPLIVRYRDYSGKQEYLEERESFFSLLELVNKKPVNSSEWLWRYEFELTINPDKL